MCGGKLKNKFKDGRRKQGLSRWRVFEGLPWPASRWNQGRNFHLAEKWLSRNPGLIAPLRKPCPLPSSADTHFSPFAFVFVICVSWNDIKVKMYENKVHKCVNPTVHRSAARLQVSEVAATLTASWLWQISLLYFFHICRFDICYEILTVLTVMTNRNIKRWEIRVE